MGLLLASATSDSPSVTPLLTSAPPLTVGCWVRPDAVTNLYVWNYSDTSVGIGLGTGGCIYLSADTDWKLSAWENSGSSTAATITDVAAGTWYYIICRSISVTNRRLAVLNSATGLIEHAQDTGSISFSAATTLYLNTVINNAGGGAGSFSDQVVAELWYTQTDIQADGLQLSDHLLRQLAYGGPFSVPHVASSVLEYRSLRSAQLNESAGGELYAQGTLPVWAAAGIRTVHPSLPYWYMAPPADTLNVSMMMF